MMELEKYLKTNLLSYKIIDNKLVYYSTGENIDFNKNSESKLWGKLFDMSYHKMETLENSIKSTKVWKNSHDGSDISDDEMKEWLDNTILRLKKLIGKNCKVLEIGSGNGLIFNCIIDYVEKYTGTDVAENGLRLIANSKKGKSNTEKIELFKLDALNIDKIPSVKYDLIIINSVAQYFPSLDYILSFFKKIEQFASPNCNIFLGDIRSYDLQKLFYFDITKKKFPSISDFDIKNKIISLQKRENETFYHSKFFKLFPKFFSYINYCSIELKNGVFNNELNKYRYDVTLSCNNKNQDYYSFKSASWKDFKNPEIEILEKLKRINNHELLEIINIPNPRILSQENEYNFLFNSNKLNQISSCSPCWSFSNELNMIKNSFFQTNFIEEDIFKFTAQFCKTQSFTNYNDNEEIEFQCLSNRFHENKSAKDLEFENQIKKKFPALEFIKISNFLFLRN
ncbi:MAG: class I SAM-dependent methyltransferase [Flavobacteriales bacterium]|nr:class I SAM-dependent methyltransferase [Flavobacteriales bacterium]